MKIYIAIALAAAPLASWSGSALAQNAAQNGVLVIYGNDRCPTNENGDEIVVCQRLDEQERFRIPKQLREFEVTPQNQAWAQRVQPTLEAGAIGVGSCSTVGPGGGTGCFVQGATGWKAQEQARRKAETDIPKP
jgi:hypothetical protein